MTNQAIYSEFEAAGKEIKRMEFRDPIQLEEFFFDPVFGQKKYASKVIGTVLLWWER